MNPPPLPVEFNSTADNASWSSVATFLPSTAMARIGSTVGSSALRRCSVRMC
jgi:hypothetical protein